MLAVMAREAQGLGPGNGPEAGEVLVTGAAGGVGSVAVAVPHRLGYRVTASTGRAETHGYLKDLGCATLIHRAEVAPPRRRPPDNDRWQASTTAAAGPPAASLPAHDPD